MEEQIKKTAARVRTTFAYFWMLPILLVLLGETGGEWVGMYAGDVRATYMAETITILLAASCVPVSLKLFSWVLIRKIDVVTLPEALRLYALWSGVRLRFPKPSASMRCGVACGWHCLPYRCLQAFSPII